MAVTVVQTVRDIRSQARDEAGTRWDATADILPRRNEALVNLYSIRPSACYVTKVTVAPPDALTSVTSGNLPVLDQFAPAIVAYVAHALLMQGQREGDVEAAAAQDAQWKLIVFPRR